MYTYNVNITVTYLNVSYSLFNRFCKIELYQVNNIFFGYFMIYDFILSLQLRLNNIYLEDEKQQPEITSSSIIQFILS